MTTSRRRSGRKRDGKTPLAAALVLWWLGGGPGSIVVTMATTERQVKRVRWREIQRNGVRECLLCRRQRYRRARKRRRANVTRPPLVLAASRSATEAAARLAPGVILELGVERAIAAGTVCFTREDLVADLGNGLGVVALRARSRRPAGAPGGPSRPGPERHGRPTNVDTKEEQR